MSQKKVIEIGKKSDLYKRKPPRRLKKKLRNFFFSVFIFIIILTIFFFASPLSRLSVIYFSPLELINRSTLIELTGLTEDEPFWRLNLADIATDLETHPLVEKATVSRRGLNALSINIDEKHVMGCVEIEEDLLYVTSDGNTISKNDGVNSVICQDIIIYGLNESDLEESTLKLFVQALVEVNPTFISLIREITYEPKFGDINRFSLILKDGNTVKVNSYTMVERLNEYQSLIQGHDVTGILNLDVGLFFEPYHSDDENGEENHQESDVQASVDNEMTADEEIASSAPNEGESSLEMSQ